MLSHGAHAAHGIAHHGSLTVCEGLCAREQNTHGGGAKLGNISVSYQCSNGRVFQGISKEPGLASFAAPSISVVRQKQLWIPQESVMLAERTCGT